MAAIVWANVTAHASALAGVDPAQQADLLHLVNTRLNVAVFGGEESATTKLARIYFAAHFASLPGDGVSSGGSTVAGPVISESTGGVARAYATLNDSGGNGDAAGWDETVWGRRYKLLLRGSSARLPRVP